MASWRIGWIGLDKRLILRLGWLSMALAAGFQSPMRLVGLLVGDVEQISAGV